MKSKTRDKTLATAETVLDFIKEFYSKHGYMASRRDVAGWLKTSTSVANYYLHILQETKRIKINDRIARGIEILEDDKQTGGIYLAPRGSHATNPFNKREG